MKYYEKESKNYKYLEGNEEQETLSNLEKKLLINEMR